jgi:hypothetical protein
MEDTIVALYRSRMMTEKEIRSWIFLAISVASQQSPATIKEIFGIADGINHAIPKQKEFRSSIDWLTKHGYIREQNSKYCLTKKGMIEYGFAGLKTKVLLNIWRNLERQLK